MANSQNLLLTSGGSSGGAASLCAAGVANLNFGSDGGGSIRIPSSCCGMDHIYIYLINIKW